VAHATTGRHCGHICQGCDPADPKRHLGRGSSLEVENGHILFQVKATDSPQILKDGTALSFRVEVADLKWWQDEWMPVVLVVYDGQKDRAYWLHMQDYLNEKNVSLDDLAPDQDRVTVRIPIKNRLRPRSAETFRQLRNRVQETRKGNR
jgi:hypothetical protein